METKYRLAAFLAPMRRTSSKLVPISKGKKGGK